MLTIKQVNAALQAAGFAGVELVRGEGYFYFCGGNADNWYQSSVYVYRLNCLTLEQWIGEAERLSKFKGY